MQTEAANEFADFLEFTGTYANKNLPEIFSGTSKFRNMVTIFKKLTKE